MKIKRILPLFICLTGSLCALSGCKDNTEVVDGGLDGTLEAVPINSLYDGIAAMYQTKNYTLEVIHTYGAYREEIPDMIFSKKYIGSDGAAYEDFKVLYNDGEGIYRVSFTDDFLSGEYLTKRDGTKYTNLWDNSIVNTMYGACPQYIKKTVTKDLTSLKIEDKDYKIAFLKTIIGNTNNFADINDLEAKYENNKVVFNLTLGSSHQYRVTLKNVGTTKSDHLKMFVANGGKPLVAKHDLSEMRRLLYLDNYVQRVYMVNEGEGFWSGFSFFTPHYFFATGSDPYVGNAYMEFDYKDDPAIDNDFDMWGIYLVNVSRDDNGQYVAYLASANAYNSSTKEIEECVRYPSIKLDLLDNLEYVKEGEIRDANYEDTASLFDGTPNKYYFIEENLVKNFVNNFSLNTSFEGVEFNTVAIEIGLAENDKDSMVCFHAIGYYPGDGMTYDILIPLYGFGDANRPALDKLYEDYNK